MSYDFSGEIDTGGPEPLGIEPWFSDVHPDLAASGRDGLVGSTVAIAGGRYTRCGNMTSNVSPIWARCLTAALGELREPLRAGDPDPREWAGRTIRRDAAEYGERIPRYMEALAELEREGTSSMVLRDLHGLRCRDLVPLLAAAVQWGVDHLSELRELEPQNGWGDAEGAITYLWDIERFCELHPKATLRISS